MGIMSSKFCFSEKLPLLETVIATLEQLTGEEIACENSEEGENDCFATVSSEVVGSAFTLIAMTQPLSYEIWRGVSAGRDYLVDALAVVLVELGGRYEYASALPAAARQPWLLAKQWYQKS